MGNRGGRSLLRRTRCPNPTGMTGALITNDYYGSFYYVSTNLYHTVLLLCIIFSVYVRISGAKLGVLLRVLCLI